MVRLELSLLGGFHAQVDGSPAVGLDTDKTRALLVYLSVESSRAHTRDALAGLLWPDLPDDAARRNLRNSLFKLRQVLGEEEGGAGLLRITPQAIQVDPNAGLRLDSAAFEALVAGCAAHRHRKPAQCSTCHARLLQAAGLYGGDFLAGFHLAGCQAFEEWHVLKREGLHRKALEVLVRLGAYHQARGEYEQALQYAYRQSELEPWREEGPRSVMRLLALTGRRSEALAQYGTYSRVLARELDAAPSAEITLLYQQIKNEDPDLTLPTRVTGRGSQTPGHNLPRSSSPFIGRQDEMARLAAQLDSPD
jgi:DNA-binding SARP family transcriptional activator